MTTDQVIKEMQCIILQFPTKLVAEQQGSTPKAVEKQRNGENAMSLRNFFNLCRANPRIAAMAAPLMGLPETDPDLVQGLSLLMNSMARSNAATDGPQHVNSAGDEDLATGDLFASIH